MKTHMQQTSLMAYADIKNDSARRQQIYRLLLTEGPLTNLDISERLHLTINFVTGAVNALVKKGLVEESHKAPSKQTGRQSIYWMVAA